MGATDLSGFIPNPYSAERLTYDVYRAGTGPAVILMAEMPGITPKVVEFARKVVDLGCSVAMPHLFGVPGKPPSLPYAMQSLARVCVAKEFNCLALGTVGPISGWLRALAKSEHKRCGGPGVGAVGMCFTGNYALAMAVEDIVVAPVLSQPSLPFPFSKQKKADAAVAPADLERIKVRCDGDGTRVLGLRFSGDKASPPERFETLKAALGDRFVAVELDSSPDNPHGHPRGAHSVLTEHLDDREGTPTRVALDSVLDLFRERLLSQLPG